MNTSIRMELPVTVPEELLSDVQSRLHYADENVFDITIDPVLRNAVTLSIAEEHVDHLSLTTDKIERLIRRSLDDRPADSPEILVDRSDAANVWGRNPMDWLVEHNQAFPLGPGQYGLGPMVLGLIRYFDEQFLKIADQHRAVHQQFPVLIPTDVMSRADYFSSFPHSCCFVEHLRQDIDVIEGFSSRCKLDACAQPTPPELAPPNFMLAPAVCYHWYHQLADSRVPGDSPKLVTAAGKCFRYEAGCMQSLERMWDFTMREIICLGTRDQVIAFRKKTIEQLTAFLDSLGLVYRIENATDPFFVGGAAAKAKFQNAFRLKYEILMPLGYKDGSLAVGSFNHHQDFFGKSFNITLPDGSHAQTGCTAMGLERWAFAFLCRHSPDIKRWPDAVAKAVSEVWRS